MARTRTLTSIRRGAAPKASALESVRSAGLLLSAVTIGVASAVSLAFEVLLTRLFALLFEYHFVFVATSLAICGLGLGAAWGAWLLAQRDTKILQPGRIMTALAIALAFDSLLFTLLPFAGTVYLQAILALPPFVLVGLLVATIFAARASDSARLYASDLLGAGIGTAGVLLLITASGAFTSMLWLALISGAAAILLLWGTHKRDLNVAVGATAAIAALVILGQIFNVPNFNVSGITDAPPDKTMMRILSDPTQKARIVETQWGPFARLDLVETADPDTKLLFTDGGAGSYMIGYDGDLSKVRDLQSGYDYLPFVNGPLTDTLILGAGAGKDIVLSLLGGSRHITAVELNQGAVDITRKYAAFNGNILDLPNVETVVSDGRSYVDGTDKQFDLIYLNLVYSQAAGQEGSPLAESYIFTEEAIRSYWKHLKPGGRIAIVTHNGFEGSRTLLTAIGALQSEGLVMRQALDRVLLYQAHVDDPDVATNVLLVTRNAMDEAQLGESQKQADALNMQMVYVPVFFELPLRELAKDLADLDTFAHNGDYNLVPTTDDQPFFYQLKWGLPETITALLILTSLLVLVFLGLAVGGHFGQGRKKALPVVYIAVFFVLLGAAYMLVMVPLVQRFYLVLGNPTLALVATLEGMLFGAGIGSLVSARIGKDLTRWVWIAMLALVVLLVAQALFFPDLRGALLSMSLVMRILAVLALTLPVGFLIGLPFPSGLRIVGAWLPGAIPAMWGLNALAAVLGSVLASAIAMLFGFQTVLILAAVLYGAAAVLLRLVRTEDAAG